MKFPYQDEVVLPENEVTPAAFSKIYSWMITENANILDLLMEVLNAATYLSIKGILDQCWEFIDKSKNLCEDTAFSLYLESRKFNNDLSRDIQHLMFSRITKYFLTLVSWKEFLELKANEIDSLLNLNNIAVFLAATHWLHHDITNRKEHIVDIMKCVRFGLLTPWELIQLKRNLTCVQIQEITKNLEIQKMIDDGLAYVNTKTYDGVCEYNEEFARLHLCEPKKRLSICDKTWNAEKGFPNNRNNISYAEFLECLAYIQQKNDHWKGMEFN